MGLFSRDKNEKSSPATDASETAQAQDAPKSLAELKKASGPIGRAFINAVDKAVQLQTGTIRAYVNWLRRQDEDATPAQVQERMNTHFRNTVSATGAGVGAAAAVPGVGLITGSAAVAGESVLFLDLAAFYTVASAYLRGDDPEDPEQRRALVLTVLSDSEGLAVVDTFVGENATRLPSKSTLARFTGPGLAEANNILTRTALKTVRKKMRRAWIGKMLPLGLGAIAGTTANRKLADVVISRVSKSLEPVPAAFAAPLPARENADESEEAAAKGLSFDPKAFVSWIRNVFSRGDEDAKERANVDATVDATK